MCPHPLKSKESRNTSSAHRHHHRNGGLRTHQQHSQKNQPLHWRNLYRSNPISKHLKQQQSSRNLPITASSQRHKPAGSPRKHLPKHCHPRPRNTRTHMACKMEIPGRDPDKSPQMGIQRPGNHRHNYTPRQPPPVRLRYLQPQHKLLNHQLHRQRTRPNILGMPRRHIPDRRLPMGQLGHQRTEYHPRTANPKLYSESNK